MARFEFTMVNDAMMQGLFEAGATGCEVVAYQMLIRGLPKDRSTADCWMPADMAEVKVGMRADVFTRSLRSLCTKTVVTSEGKPAPILTKISRGCRGHCPHYEDTLGQLIAEGKYPPPIARQAGHAIAEANGTPTGAPIEQPNGRQSLTPIAEFSTSECKAKTDQLEGKNEPIARQTCPPIETIRDVHLVADALLPTAERSVGVSQPHKQDSTSERLQVVTETEPARAPACAAQGRTAAALPSQAEWERVARLLETEGLDALSDDDRQVYHAGHKTYATNGYVPE